MHLIAAALSSPAVTVAGVDPSAVLLHPLRAYPRPEWRSIGGTDMEAHVAALNAVVAELDRRLSIFLQRQTDKIVTFDSELPLVVVVMEEYPGLIAAAEDDDAFFARRVSGRLAPAIRRNVARLVRESAKVGFRVVTIAQRADAAVLGGNDRSNYASRITLRVDNLDAVRMLHPHCSTELAAEVSAFPAGVGLLQSPAHPLRRVKFPRFSYAEYLEAVRGVHSGQPASGS
jgi:S-DNA-T family DNA segregation ATPase FtsK/SpoIIIE